MSLSDKFQKFVGVIVKDPGRITFDCDTPEAVEIAQMAQAEGLMVSFKKPGEAKPAISHNVLYVDVTQDGVPAEKQGWGWRVKSLSVT